MRPTKKGGGKVGGPSLQGERVRTQRAGPHDKEPARRVVPVPPFRKGGTRVSPCTLSARRHGVAPLGGSGSEAQLYLCVWKYLTKPAPS